jgi:hypothetical protein
MLEVLHGISMDPGEIGAPHVLIAQTTDEPDTLSRVGVKGFERFVYIHWENHASALGFHALFFTATETLFVSAGGICATISMPSGEIVSRRQPVLFWQFSGTGDFVLERGELECCLYTQGGECMACVPCDPPYDLIEGEKGIRVKSPVYGEQVLPYPNIG